MSLVFVRFLIESNSHLINDTMATLLTDFTLNDF